MLRTILFFICCTIYLIITLPLLVASKITKSKKIPIFFVKNFAKMGNFVAGNKVKVVNKEYLNNQKVLIVSNHEGIFDVFLIFAYYKYSLGFISKIENKKIPILNLWIKEINMLMMDRSDIRQSLRIINQASELINTSQSIGVMPTGTRSFEELEFNNGTFKIALKAKCDILPITLMNTGEIFERNKKIKKANTIMYVHPLLKYEEFKDMDTIEIAKKVENIIYGAKNKKEI